MKNIALLILLALIFSCTRKENKNSFFLWDYTTKSELSEVGFKPAKAPNKPDILEDWLWKSVKDTDVNYFFNGDILLNKMIHIRNVDSSKLFSFLGTIGFKYKGDSLVFANNKIKFLIQRHGKSFFFTQKLQ